MLSRGLIEPTRRKRSLFRLECGHRQRCHHGSGYSEEELVKVEKTKVTEIAFLIKWFVLRHKDGVVFLLERVGNMATSVTRRAAVF